MRRILSGLVLVAVLAGTVGTGGAASAPDSPRSSYIVVLRNGAGDPGQVAADHARREGATVTNVYRHALRGYSARMSATAATRLASDSRVAYVESDGPVSIVETTQSNPTWGLDRIDERDLPLDGSYTYGPTGSGVTAYIIDTGIRFAHSDFGGRATSGFDSVDGGSADDCNGHGTHVAGTVGGTTYGVAKGVSLVAVRVLNCSGSGTWSGVIAGIDWATADHAAGAPAVANMSLGGGASSAVDTAVQNSIADGITYGVAAGNGNQAGIAQDACASSPSRVPEALTVGATSSTDAKASWSNYGTCLDLFAPGVSITSAWYTSDTATNTISGTSMATPHVVGVAALFLQGNTGASPATVAGAITTNATPNKVTGAGTGSPNLLLYSVFGGGTPVPPPPTYALTLTATKGSKVKGQTTVTLNWETSETVQVTRNGLIIAGSVTGSTYPDTVRGGTYTYQVCRTSIPTECSNPYTISV